jgi:pyruvate ferredoxin oxidoreductase alpha subunit
MLIATRLAEHPDVLLPVLVCQDGFTITHSAEPVSLLDDDVVREFVGDYRIPNPLLDLSRPTTQGPFAMPDYYFELRHQQGAAMHAALPVFEQLAAELAALSGRRYHAVEPYALGGAEHVMLCLGSSAGTVKDVVDELRDEGEPVGLLELRSFRPLPREDLREALETVRIVSVLDRADSPGGAPPLFADLAAAVHGLDVELRSFVYGLGGRDLHPEDIRVVFEGHGPTYVGLRGAPCPV